MSLCMKVKTFYQRGFIIGNLVSDHESNHRRIQYEGKCDISSDSKFEIAVDEAKKKHKKTSHIVTSLKNCGFGNPKKGTPFDKFKRVKTCELKKNKKLLHKSVTI